MGAPGIVPYGVWVQFYPDPDLKDLVQRYQAILLTVAFCRKAGYEPRPEWLRELGVA